MVHYANGKIYRINDELNRCMYVGSTQMPLRNRWWNHKHKRDDWHIEMIESYPCTHRHELESREEYWRLTYKPTLNKKRCSTGILSKTTRELYYRSARYKELYFPKFQCSCGRVLIARHRERHIQTRIHANRMRDVRMREALYLRRHPIWDSIYPVTSCMKQEPKEPQRSPFTVVHHALQDWGLICLTFVDYWAKSIMQSLLGIIGDLAFFLINSARCFGNLIKG